MFKFYPFLVNHLVPAREWDAIIFCTLFRIEPTDLRFQIRSNAPLFLTSLAPKWQKDLLSFMFTLMGYRKINVNDKGECLVKLQEIFTTVCTSTVFLFYFSERCVWPWTLNDIVPWNEGHHILSNHCKYNHHSMFRFSMLS